MKILHVIGTLDPAYGGPVEALRQLSKALTDLGQQTETVTLDGPDAHWIADWPVPVHALGPSIGKYRYNTQLVPWLMNNANEYDAVIARGIWQCQSFSVSQAARKRGFPYFVFVHGALDPWLKRAVPLKNLKKWIYWLLVEYRVLRDAKAVIFTSEEERLLARQSFRPYRAIEAVVDYGTSAPKGNAESERDAFLSRFPRLRNKRILLFLSRIHQKKGLDLLIDAFAKISVRDSRLHLVVAGPDQEGLQADLIALAEEWGVASRITWTGMLEGDVRWGAYHAAEVFCLPSHSENFGMVVAEALARGLPVLISDKVNIWREIDSDGAGLVAPDTPVGALSLLERWLDFDETERKNMVERTRSCFARRFEIKKAAQTLMVVIENHIGRSSPSR